MQCERCGRDNPDGALYCAFCGVSLSSADTASQEQPPAGPTPTPPPPPARPAQIPAASHAYSPSEVEKPLSGLAIASLILGVLGFVTMGITSLVGLIIGIVALVQTSRPADRVRGQGLAVAGSVLSGFTLLFFPLLAAILFPVFARAREKAREASCMSNLKQLALGVVMYTTDYDGKYPIKESWADLITPYIRNTQILVCPSARDQTQQSYAYNELMSGITDMMMQIAPAEAVLTFDSQVGTNLAGGRSLVELRHRGGANFAFLDGHVKWCSGEKVDGLGWDPLFSERSSGEVDSSAGAPAAGAP